MTESKSINRCTVLKLTGTSITGGITLGGPGTAHGDRGKSSGTSAGYTESSKTYSWFLEFCRAVIAVVPVDAEELATHLPEGFTPKTPEDFGLPPDPRGDAVMGLEAFTCEISAALKGTINDAPYLSYFAPVVPPAAYEDPDARYHFVKWDVLIADDDLRTELQDHGLPAAAGEVTFELAERSAEQFTFDVTGTIGGETHRFTGSAALPEGGPEGFTFLEFTPIEDRVAMWDVSVDDASLLVGTGILELAPGSLPAEVVGDETTQAYILAGDLSFPDATISIPRGKHPDRQGLKGIKKQRVYRI